MKRTITILLLCPVLIIAAHGLCHARTLTIALNYSVAPYIFPQSKDGIEYDIIREALEYTGHSISPQFMPNYRVLQAIENKAVDAAAPLPSSLDIEGIYFSDSHITYRNVAVSTIRAPSTRDIRSIKDLLHHKVMAFQNAHKFLPEAFQRLTLTHPRYEEIASQLAQVRSFFGRQDRVIVLEQRIFRYLMRTLPAEERYIPFTVHTIFPPNHYTVAFMDEGIRDDFNRGLAWLKASGRYEQILQKYLGQGANRRVLPSDQTAKHKTPRFGNISDTP